MAPLEPPEGNDVGEWGQYRRMILAELRRNNAEVKEVNQKFDQFRSEVVSQILIDIAMLKVKAGLWGGMGGLLSGLAAFLVWMATNSQ